MEQWGSEKLTDSPLIGKRILVAEDDFLISLELQTILSAAGAEVVGPARTLDVALSLADQPLSAAVLDVRLGRFPIIRVARTLTSRKIPFVFYTGQVRTDPVLAEWPEVKVITKPTPPRVLILELSAILDPSNL
jgi:DNA-binding response OmpR family regulator